METPTLVDLVLSLTVLAGFRAWKDPGLRPPPKIDLALSCGIAAAVRAWIGTPGATIANLTIIELVAVFALAGVLLCYYLLIWAADLILLGRRWHTAELGHVTSTYWVRHPEFGCGTQLRKRRTLLAVFLDKDWSRPLQSAGCITIVRVDGLTCELGKSTEGWTVSLHEPALQGVVCRITHHLVFGQHEAGAMHCLDQIQQAIARSAGG